MSEIILLKVRHYLENHGDKIPYEVSLTDDGTERTFRLRMSNIGRPGCVLQAEKFGLKRDPVPYSARFRNMYGNAIESMAVAIMKNAGVRIVSEQEPVSLEIAGEMIDGTLDLVIDEEGPKVYDVKSASSYAFNHKYIGKNLGNLWEEGDDFGYVTQLYGYAEAKKLPVGGLICINKENGEWCIVPPPTLDEALRSAALSHAASNVRLIESDAPFRRNYPDIPETFRGKYTGHRILSSICSFCPFREGCWPQAQCLPQLNSKGKTPKHFYYTRIGEPKHGKPEEVTYASAFEGLDDEHREY